MKKKHIVLDLLRIVIDIVIIVLIVIHLKNDKKEVNE